MNGKKLGSHRGGLIPFQFEVLDSILKAKDNFLVVKVDNKRKADEIPILNTDWWNYGGITRNVLLVEVSQKFIKDYSIHLKKGAANWPAASIDNYVGEDNKETIFSIKYTYTSDYDGNTDGNHWMVMFGLREQSTFPYGNGWGGGTSQVCTNPNGPNCWTYAPNYTSDTWAAEKRDYGFMTFSLKGGSFLKTDHKGVAGVGTESGTFFLNVNNLTLTTSGATPLHVPYTPSDAVSMFSWRILSLTENTMQLAVKNKAKDEYQVLNFISKSYSDNWTPAAPPPAKPDEGLTLYLPLENCSICL